MRILLFLLAILSLSQAAGFSRLSGAPPELISFWRMLFASSIMGLLSLWKARRDDGALPDFKELRRGKTPFFALGSGLFFWLHLWSFQFAAQNTPIANVMIIFSTNPMFTGLISVGLLKQHFERRLIPAYLLSVAAIYILVSHHLTMDPSHTPGDLAALASALCFSLYILFGHQARKTLSNSTYTYFIYSFAGVGFFLTTILRGLSFVAYPTITWLSIAGLVIFPTLLGHALFTYLLRYININWMSTGKLAEPILASVTAYFFFGEVWTSATYWAFACSGASLLILLRPWNYLRGM